MTNQTSTTIINCQGAIAQVPARRIALLGARTILSLRSKIGIRNNKWPSTTQIKREFKLKSSVRDIPAMIEEINQELKS